MDSASKSKVLKLLSEDREFLHDISTPITVAQGMLSMANGQIDKGISAEDVLSKLKKSEQAMEQIVEMVMNRRQELIQQQEQEQET